MKTAIHIILLVGPALSWMTGCALQGDMARMQERMIAVERQNQDLQRRNSALEKRIQDDLVNIGQSSQTAEKTLRTQYASMNVNLDTIQQEIRLLTGRIEEVEYSLNSKFGNFEADQIKRREQLDEIGLTVEKLDQRLVALEQYLSMDRKTAAAGSGAVPVEQAPTLGSLYDAAKKAFDKREYEKSRQLFGQMLKSDPKSENADNAQFWIGESYYNEKWFEKAILEYQTVIEQYPKGNKVPAALLKQGLAFLELGDRANARLVLKRLTETHPKSNEAAVAQAKLKEL